MGRNVTFSADHESNETAPSLNPTNGTTDANGQACAIYTVGTIGGYTYYRATDMTVYLY